MKLAQLVRWNCPWCGGLARKSGYGRKGQRRVYCLDCGHTWYVKRVPHIMDGVRVKPERVLKFVEAVEGGASVRRASREAGFNHITGFRLLKRLRMQRLCKKCGQPITGKYRRSYCSDQCSPWPSRAGWRKQNTTVTIAPT